VWNSTFSVEWNDGLVAEDTKLKLVSAKPWCGAMGDADNSAYTWDF